MTQKATHGKKDYVREGTYHSTHVVDYVFQQIDSSVLMTMAKAYFDETAADPDHRAGGPGFLRVPGIP